jgi:hypothetical protein
MAPTVPPAEDAVGLLTKKWRRVAEAANVKVD